MKVLTFIFARLIQKGRYARALALLPLLWKTSLRELGSGILRVLQFLVSGRAGLKEFAALFAGILYIFLPTDFLPDFIPGVGWLDDAAIFTLLTGYLYKKANDFREKQKSAA
ncbi:YkvA family protein [Desulfomonile tiedjei]|uniref:DUF1232 domain-containing protein n=1 Tax=Desulfomonile tiedjei (strain ATCC 49306 / DSM 6799 / DCB-1) TaxID=706587 RepID=I4CAG7_DESTA|nr:YkvA family protein [Desulfomonile tiedjei]AFM26558.1 hypothetical protein Desti_3916 [Desulfomonile tiedjei DSM 6799]